MRDQISVARPDEPPPTSPIPRLAQGVELPELDLKEGNQECVVSIPPGRHFRVSVSTARLLRLIDGRRSVRDIAVAMSRRTSTPLSTEDVRGIIDRVLAPKGLVVSEGWNAPVPRRRLSSLWLRLRLLPASLVDVLSRRLTSLFSWKIAGPVLFVMFGSHAWLWYARASSAMPDNALSPGVVAPVILLFLASILAHEFGHASALRSFGQAPGDIGVGMYLILPVFYCDVCRAWRLPRLSRVVVDLGGIYFQMLFGSLLLGLYVLFGRAEFARTALLIDASLLVTLNPFLRMDGYWLASDLSGTTNLRARSIKRLGALLCGRVRSTEEGAWFLSVYALASGVFLSVFGVLAIRYGFPGLLANIWGAIQRLLLYFQTGEGQLPELLGAGFSILLGVLMLIGIGIICVRLVQSVGAIFLPKTKACVSKERCDGRVVS